MEIPYIVTPRKDTGLFNSKIAIWLFLASEVMLFGAFFSAYVFLRMSADYPWPERALPVLPGLINTFVLIGSSVTVVFAWASLMLGNWQRFQIFMGITIFCAAIFMVLKGIEYHVKLHHQAVRLKDYSVVEGHLGYEKEGNKEVLDYRGKKFEENKIFVEASKLTFSTLRFYHPWVKDCLGQAEQHHATITLAEDVKATTKLGETDQILAKAGEPLSIALLEKLQKTHIAARSHNAKVRTEAASAAWKKAEAGNPGMKGWQIEKDGLLAIDEAAIKPQLLSEVSVASFNVSPPTKFIFAPRDIKEGATQSRLRDDTVLDGKLLDSPMTFHYVDAVDFQHLAMKAAERGVDPEQAIEASWLIKSNPEIKQAWEWHKADVAKLEATLLSHGVDKKGNARYVPTPKERYRIDWKAFVKKAEEHGGKKIPQRAEWLENFTGPNYEARNPVLEPGAHTEEHAANGTFPHLSVPRDQIQHSSKFNPAWNPYYAIYFTMTGLHGLHVIGGALVLAYYLFFGRKMFLRNPQWLANRVEVAGLFWHFVDIVWIFVFPVLYLM